MFVPIQTLSETIRTRGERCDSRSAPSGFQPGRTNESIHPSILYYLLTKQIINQAVSLLGRGHICMYIYIMTPASRNGVSSFTSYRAGNGTNHRYNSAQCCLQRNTTQPPGPIHPSRKVASARMNHRIESKNCCHSKIIQTVNRNAYNSDTIFRHACCQIKLIYHIQPPCS